MTSFAVWRPRPVFVTSTFRDMHAERDYLHHHVFPELEERLRERFHNLEPVDLRWGVETMSEVDQQAKELLVLKVCLAEIERCRPFVIALIGDRYGWVPPAECLKAASQEANYRTDLIGKSVTALEIEFGVLDCEGQRRRSRIYVRDPLPYDELSPQTAAHYSDAHSSDPGSREACERLAGLKARIEREMPGRVRRYQAGWDPVRERVTGLEDWGRRVLDDLWQDLEEDTRGYVLQPVTSWQEQEARLLERFLETQCRDFTGREELIGQLLRLASEPTTRDTDWAACVVGGPGSGKSSLFAQLCRLLQRTDVFLLAHAAGISMRANEVATLLRRWIGDLAATLKMRDPSENLRSSEDLEKTFAEMLSRVATGRRVVCVIDALNQFERTPPARHVTWLPQSWPPNARLITTSVRGSESEALANLPGAKMFTLPPLNEGEARQIARVVCSRYHKSVPTDVLDLLASKRNHDGSPAAGIPLWLELALEELLLLDADDFERADREYAGTTDQKLHALLLDVAGKLPPEIESLYAWMLTRTEEVHGAIQAGSFASLVALSRSGWRDSDFRRLLPRLTNGDWDDLRFAALRRTFRAHVIQRGAQAEWDFAHTQMRAAVFRRYLPDPGRRHELNRILSDHLLDLPADDPLRRNEAMFHLIGADDRVRAAGLCAELADPSDAGAPAFRTVAEHILAKEDSAPGEGIRWVSSLLGQPGIAPGQLLQICRAFQESLNGILSFGGHVGIRLQLLQAVRNALTGIAKRDRTNGDALRALRDNHI